MDVLFTPVSFILSVPDVDIVPNCALKTRGASTALGCLFPRFGVCTDTAEPLCLASLLSPNFKGNISRSLPRSCCRFLVSKAPPLMKQADPFSPLSLNQHPGGRLLQSSADVFSRDLCMPFQKAMSEARGHSEACGISETKESHENVPSTLVFLCYNEECIDRAIFSMQRNLVSRFPDKGHVSMLLVKIYSYTNVINRADAESPILIEKLCRRKRRAFPRAVYTEIQYTQKNICAMHLPANWQRSRTQAANIIH